MTTRIVIDTNVIVSALRSNKGASFQLLSLIDSGKFRFGLSVPIVIEYEAAAKRLVTHGGLSAADIEAIIDKSDLGAGIKERAKKIFYEVAVAEAKVHNSTLDKIHFHEVGAIDSLVDIVGTAICLDVMKIDRVYSSPVKVGSGGTVNTQHGPMPIPTPVTAVLTTALA